MLRTGLVRNRPSPRRNRRMARGDSEMIDTIVSLFP
jgi:hypothetical protein